MAVKGPTPTARSLAECRKRGWLAGVVERRLPRGFTTVDLFGFIDAVALDGKPGLLAIQATSENGGNVAKRVDKILDECADAARRWLQAGNRIEVWGWGKRGEAGKRKRWTLRVVPVEHVPELVVDTFCGHPILASSLSNEPIPDYAERVAKYAKPNG